MDEEDMEEIIEGFAKGGQNAEAAGLDGVEICAAMDTSSANFYLPIQIREKINTEEVWRTG
jgi:2,4-dienoyl-CoA reductase-like NADH-dependent reductase (Old Yellow Enzyme family)